MSSSVELWLLFTFCMFLLFISSKRSRYGILTDESKQYIYKEKMFYTVVTCLMSIFIGLRIWCNDTGTYREIYDYLTPSEGGIFTNISWKIGDSPAFWVFNSFLKHQGVSTQNFLMIYAIITIFLYMWFIWKYTTDIWFSVFLLWTMGVYLFAAAGMRQAIAIAIALIGIDGYLQKNFLRFIFWICLAALFHPYAFLFLLVPFLTFSPWKRKTWYMFGLFAIIGVFLQKFVGSILSLTSMMGKGYDSMAFSGEGVNLFRLLVTWAPIILSFTARKSMKKSYDKKNNIFMNFSMLNASIMFVALFGTANYFARLANYFLIFQTLSLPWIVKYFNAKTRKFVKPLIIFCYLLYFVFANVILTPFDLYFAKMSFWEYIKSNF